MAEKKVEIYLSGGASNSDPDASLGGVQSTEKLVGQVPVYNGAALSGVTLIDSTEVTSLDVKFNTFSGQKISIKLTTDADYTNAPEVDISVDGQYIIPHANGAQTLTILVVAASLPGSTSYAVIGATDIMHNLFDTVPSSDSEVGAVNYRHFYIENISGALFSMYLIINAQFNGFDYLEIGIENPDGLADDTLLADESTPPPGVVFSAPSSIDSAQLIDMAAAGMVGIFLKRTVLPLTDIDTPIDTAMLEIVELA